MTLQRACMSVCPSSWLQVFGCICLCWLTRVLAFQIVMMAWTAGGLCDCDRESASRLASLVLSRGSSVVGLFLASAS